MRPEMRQPRLLPTPDELLPGGVPAPAYKDLVRELQDLGRSLKEQQIQPIVIYPGTSSMFPTARYLMLVGQRRWTAAWLVGMESLDAIIVDPPSPTDRIRIQYAENEDREEFSDMERAWSLQQMKVAMGDVPWEQVEERLQLSRARRHQFIRLLAFSSAQQRSVARLRLQETQIRPLHTAVRNGELTPGQVDGILQRLAEIVVERSNQPVGEATDAHSVAIEEVPSSQSTMRRGVDGPTIARLVARAHRTTTAPTSRPRWLGSLEEHVTRTRQALQRAYGRIDGLSSTDIDILSTLLYGLREDVEQIFTRIDQRRQETGEDEGV